MTARKPRPQVPDAAPPVDDKPSLEQRCVEWSNGVRAIVRRLERLQTTALWHEPIRSKVLPRHVAEAWDRINDFRESVQEMDIPGADTFLAAFKSATDPIGNVCASGSPSEVIETVISGVGLAEREHHSRIAKVPAFQGRWIDPEDYQPPKGFCTLSDAQQRAGLIGSRVPVYHPVIEALKPDADQSVRVLLTDGQRREIDQRHAARIGQSYPDSHTRRPLDVWMSGDFALDASWGEIATEVLIRDLRQTAINGKVVVAGEELDLGWFFPTDPASAAPGFQYLREKHPDLLNKDGPAAVLRVLLKNQDIVWNANNMANSDDLGNERPKGKPSPKAVRGWVAELVAAGLVVSFRTGKAKTFRFASQESPKVPKIPK